MTIDTDKLKEAFLTEADLHIKAMNNALVALEKNPQDKVLFHEIFRGIHTLKSLAATMEYQQTLNLCHAIEDLMDAIRNNDIDFLDSIEILFKGHDYLNENLNKLNTGKSELSSENLIKEIHRFIAEESQTRSAHAHGKKHPIKQDEMLSHETETLTSANNEAILPEKIQTIAVKVDRLDILMNLAEELLVNKLKFDAIREEISHPDLNPAVESLGRLISDLQYYVLQVRLVPIGFVFNRFVRMIRDLAKQQQKSIDLKTEGSDIELDRLLIDEIGASIAHLIKNAIDHGIESSATRKKLNKPKVATILLSARRTKETAIIEVTDDGSGLNLDDIRRAAIKAKLVTPNATSDEILNTIFLGLSTTENVTAVSGRGLGLSIVKQKIESIGGTIRANSIAGHGTSFLMEIPLTLAIIKTLFVKVSEDIYAIPIEAVERLLVIKNEGFKWLLNDETIIYHDNVIPVIRLSNVFNSEPSYLEKQPVIIINKGKHRLGLIVDSLLSTQEVVIKPLSRTVKDNKFFSGAAMIGSGQMILILDVGYFLSLGVKNTKNLSLGNINLVNNEHSRED